MQKCHLAREKWPSRPSCSSHSTPGTRNGNEEATLDIPTPEMWPGEKPSPTDNQNHSLGNMASVKLSRISIHWSHPVIIKERWAVPMESHGIPDPQNPEQDKCCLTPLCFRVVCASEIDNQNVSLKYWWLIQFRCIIYPALRHKNRCFLDLQMIYILLLFVVPCPIAFILFCICLKKSPKCILRTGVPWGGRRAGKLHVLKQRKGEKCR